MKPKFLFASKDVCIFASVLRDFAKFRILFLDQLDEKFKTFKQRVAGSSPARLTLAAVLFSDQLVRSSAKRAAIGSVRSITSESSPRLPM